MSTTFYPPRDGFFALLNAAYTAGATSLSFVQGLSGRDPGTVSTGSPLRFSMIPAAALDTYGRITDWSNWGVYAATGRSGGTLSGLSFTGVGVDVNRAAGDVICEPPLSLDITDLQTAVTSISVPAGSVWRNGMGPPSNTLGNDGDYYLNTSTGDVYVRASGSYGSPVANLTGPTGAKGDTGATGATGPAGPNTIVVGTTAVTGGSSGQALTIDSGGKVAAGSFQAAGSYAVTTNNLSDLSSASTARSNLGLTIGTNVQAYSATLDGLAAANYVSTAVLIGQGTGVPAALTGSGFVVLSGGAPTARALVAGDIPTTLSGMTLNGTTTAKVRVPTPYQITYGASITANLGNGDDQYCNLTGNVSVTISGGTAGQRFTLEFVQDATGGRTITIASAYLGSLGTLTYTANTRTVLAGKVCADGSIVLQTVVTGV